MIIARSGSERRSKVLPSGNSTVGLRVVAAKMNGVALAKVLNLV
jgi:hypothetical protein